MKSIKGITVGLIALLTADVVVAGRCKPGSISSISTETKSSASTESLVPTTVDVSVTTESSLSTSAASLETSSETQTSLLSTTATSSSIETSSASSIISSIFTSTELLSTTEITTADQTTETVSTTTTTEAAVLPTIANPGFDDNNNGSPWVITGQVSSGAVFWKRSGPNIISDQNRLIRPGQSIAQQIDGLRTSLSYRIRFFWVKFDTPSATAGCQLSATFGGQDLGTVALLPPRTPNSVFEEYVSVVHQPSNPSEELRIRMDCISAGQTNRFYVDDVSIEFV
ncbi:hypothetical protein BFJ72_g9357 [Fusarium proliferatum]|uniref:CBM-cenC domain-containing protein n=1 Tax=Gibberella intermedia TaxID=948311 RepID=A0A420SZB7_GIBIN|nr:hypothetical protein BFJ72_g9357 [Fusarium proliferatum]